MDIDYQMREIGFKISTERTYSGMSQKQLAVKANITQQQLSGIENGLNCTLLTLLKVSHALGMELNISG